jgi:hypothetical protein
VEHDVIIPIVVRADVAYANPAADIPVPNPARAACEAANPLKTLCGVPAVAEPIIKLTSRGVESSHPSLILHYEFKYFTANSFVPPYLVNVDAPHCGKASSVTGRVRSRG